MTHVRHLHAETMLNVNNFNKDDSSAVVKKAGKDHCAIKTLMTVPSSHVPLEPTVLILWTIIDAIAQLDLMESDVNKK